jgi:SAM-dependent methyltransferase
MPPTLSRLSPDERDTIYHYTENASFFAMSQNPYSLEDPIQAMMLREYWDIWYKEIDRFTSHIEGRDILSLGCGTAFDAQYFNQKGYVYTGIDITRPMLEVARDRGSDERLTQMNMYELGFKSNSFDAIWLFDSICHIPREKIPILLKEIHRVLKPRGVAYIRIATEGENEQYREGYGFISNWAPEKFGSELISSAYTIKENYALSDAQTCFIVQPIKEIK